MINLRNKIAGVLATLGIVGMLYGVSGPLTKTTQRDLKRYGYEIYLESDFFAGSWEAKRRPTYGGGYEYLGSLTDDERKEYDWNEWGLPLIFVAGGGIISLLGAALERKEDSLN